MKKKKAYPPKPTKGAMKIKQGLKEYEYHVSSSDAIRHKILTGLIKKYGQNKIRLLTKGDVKNFIIRWDLKDKEQLLNHKGWHTVQAMIRLRMIYHKPGAKNRSEKAYETFKKDLKWIEKFKRPMKTKKAKKGKITKKNPTLMMVEMLNPQEDLPLWDEVHKLCPAITKAEYKKSLVKYREQHHADPDNVEKVNVDNSLKNKVLINVGKLPKLDYIPSDNSRKQDDRKTKFTYRHKTEGKGVLASTADGFIVVIGPTVRKDGWVHG